MIATTDIANILYRDIKMMGFAVSQEGNVPAGPLTAERVVIHAKQQTVETTWKKNFAEVNFLVPDTADGKADLVRLNVLERYALEHLRAGGRYDDTTYTYAPVSTCILELRDFKAHYVNAKLLFRVINTI